jgi:beta-lactamase superfamily II metal-dependent hydrolase
MQFSRAFCSVILLVGLLGCGVTAPAPVGESVRVTFLDVGQGDAVLIRSPEGQDALVDAGWSNPVTSLKALDVDELELLVATHPHADHIGGMANIINSIPVHFYMDNGQTHTTATYEGLASTLQQRTDITYLIAEPRSISLGSVEIEVLPLLPITPTDFNNRSIGLVVRYGDFAAFLSGDSEVEELSFWTQQDAVPDVTVLKAGHHGSYNGFTSEFLEDAEPELVAISVGSNTYGHPHAEALEAYGSAAETVLRTDLDGQITIVGYKDGRYEVVLGQEVIVMGQGPSLDSEARTSCPVQIQAVAGCVLRNKKTGTGWISTLDLLDSKGLRAMTYASIFYD